MKIKSRAVITHEVASELVIVMPKSEVTASALIEICSDAIRVFMITAT